MVDFHFAKIILGLAKFLLELSSFAASILVLSKTLRHTNDDVSILFQVFFIIQIKATARLLRNIFECEQIMTQLSKV